MERRAGLPDPVLCEVDVRPHAEAFAALLPPGDPFWGDALEMFRGPGPDPENPREEWALIETLAASNARIAAAVCALQRELTPGTTDLLLEAHERDFGLPDPCLGSLTIYRDARRDAVIARMNASMRQHEDDWEAYAAAAGYDITVTTSPPTNLCDNTLCDPVAGSEWWRHIQIRNVPVYWSNLCDNTLCDPIGGFDIDRIICLLRQVIGPQYVVTFAITPME